MSQQQEALNNQTEQEQLKEIHNIPQRQNENASLIQSLKQTPSFLIQKYNEKLRQQNPARPVRAGGVYVPPHRLRQMQEEIMQKDAGGIQHQKMMWQLLRKSINGIVNKVNISNIQNIVIQLFNQNILRGKGLLSKSIIKAQMASPNFTHVYSALIAVINTKLPEIGNLILKRVMIQFRRAFQRNNKIVCIATTKMIAHLINQKVLGEYAGLQLLFILLNQPTQASVQIACDFMIEAGQVLSEITPAGANAIFQRFKTLLHQAQISQKAQYSIQSLFAIRKTGFKQHPGVIPELDLVQGEDQITHNMDFEEQLGGQQNLNIFKFDPFYQRTQQEWDSIKLQILGQQNIINLKQMRNYEQQMLEQQQAQQQNNQPKIQDLTEQDLINLRRTIYLIIQSTVNFQECAHKLLKMNIAKGYQHQLVDMIIECCMMQRIYQNFFGLLAQRFCSIQDLYKQLFIKAFINHYNTIFKLEVNKIRNLAKLFSHLIYRFAIDWTIFQVIVLKPQTTTAAGRMFLKILFKEIAENLGNERMMQEFNRQQMRQYYQGLFPIDHPNNLRFAINYFTSIGLGQLTQNMRDVLQMQQEIILNRKQKQQEEKYLQQLKQQEQMLRLMQEEQNREKQMLQIIEKQRQQERKIARQKLLKQQQENQRVRKAQSQKLKQQQSKRKKKSSSSSSSSNSSSSSSSSSSGSSNQSQTPVRSRQKYTDKKTNNQRKKRQSSSSSRSSDKSVKYKKTQNSRKYNARQRSRQRRPNKQQLRQKQSKKRHSSSSSESPEKKKSNLPYKISKDQQKQNQTKNVQQQRQKDNKKQKNTDIASKIKFEQLVLSKKQVQKQKKRQPVGRRESQAQSSGISSSSSSQDSSDSQSGQISQQDSPKKQKVNKKRKSSDQQSSSSSSQSSVDTNQLYRRKLKKEGRN